MIKKHTPLLLVLILIGSVLCTSNTIYGQCIDPVKRYVNEVTSMSDPENNQVYFMQSTIKSIPPKSSSLTASTVTTKIYRSKDQVVYEAGDIDMYQDKTDAFMIVHPLKRIVWGKNPEEKPENNAAKIAGLQKLLIEESEVVSCERKRADHNHEVLKIKLKTNEKIKEEFKVDFSLLDFDMTTNQLIKVETIYSKNQPLARQIIEYEKLDYNYKGHKLKNARSMIFNANGDLKPAFSNYTIIEN